jgi:DNA-binding PadR family transcriptional regulator
MPIPQLTHLQFLVVSELLRGEKRGRDLRARLRAENVRQSGPGFYQMMAALEDAGFVAGRYEQEVIDGQIIRQRHYKVNPTGKKAWQESRDFYMQVIGARQRDLAHGR